MKVFLRFASSDCIAVASRAILLGIALGRMAMFPAAAADSSAISSGDTLQEVIVTAEKRDEPLDKVPIAIEVLTPSQMALANVTNSVDLPTITPGLITITGPNANAYNTPFIRGVGSTSTEPGDDASVATYIDGVYQSDKTANLFEFNNIDQIEILKGPQGTLFGRNSTGGAINITLKQPSFTPQMDFSGSYGSYDESHFNGYVTGPVTDKLAASFSVGYRNGGNFGTDDATGGKYGGIWGWAINGKILWNATDNLELWGSIIYNNRRQSNASANETLVPDSLTLGKVLDPNAQWATTNYHFDGRFPPMANLGSTEEQLHGRYRFDGFDVLSITAVHNSESDVPLDFGATTANDFYAQDHQTTHDWSQEFQFISTGNSPFQWVGGLFYMYDKEASLPLTFATLVPYPLNATTTAATMLDFGCALSNPACFASVVSLFPVTVNNSYAAYGEISYKISETDKVTLGFRYTEEKRSIEAGTFFEEPTPAATGDYVFTPVLLAATNQNVTYTKPTWRAAYMHDFTDDIHAFASYNRGFKSGAYNQASPSEPSVNPETIDAGEAGVKSRWLNNRLQVNASGYYYKYSDIQVQVVRPAAVLEQNAASARLFGMDLDFNALPTENLRLNGGLSLENAKYTSFDSAAATLFPIPGDPSSTATGLGMSASINATGTQMLYAPNLTADVGAAYTTHLGNGSSLVFATNVYYTDSYKMVEGDGSLVFAHENVDADVTWNSRSSRFFVRMFGHNLTNREQVGTQLTTLFYAKMLQPPLTVGVAAGFKM